MYLISYQKNNVGVLIQSSGHTDPLSLTSTEIYSLNSITHKQIFSTIKYGIVCSLFFDMLVFAMVFINTP